MRQNNHVLSLVDDMDSPEIVGNRLYKIRCVANYPGVDRRTGKQKAWAEKIGLPPKSYHQWESGSHGHIPIYAALKICEWTGYGVDLDYIYTGRLDGVGPGWSLPLRDAADRPTLARRAGSPRTVSAPKRSGSSRRHG